MRLSTVLAATALVAASIVTTPAPAGAAIFGGSVRHWSPDHGYDKPFLIRCGNSRGQTDTFSLLEGQHSDWVCADEDVDAIYVRYGEEIKCWVSFQGRGSWNVTWDATGWHKVGNLSNKRCVNGLD